MDRNPHARNVTLLLLRRTQHVLFAVLLIVGCVRALNSGERSAWVLLAASALLAAWYGLGIVLSRTVPRPGYARGWLAFLVLGWIGLTLLSPDFVWLAFTLFLLAMQMLPGAAGPVSVAAMTAIAVLVSAWHTGGFTAAAALGPVIGATVAVVIMIVYRGLTREVETRNRLLAELSAAQDRLAAAERRAGTLDERQRLADGIHDTVAQS
ncbi:MAG: sensor histidine kinase, partial [Stackebrandtia sp.]